MGLRSKKGYAYFIEMALAVVIIGLVFNSIFESEQEVFTYKKNQDLEEIGFNVLKNLDAMQKLNITQPIETNIHIRNSLPATIDFDWEYYNTTCNPFTISKLDPAFEYCGSINASTNNDVASAAYTRHINGQPETWKIYLWRKL